MTTTVVATTSSRRRPSDLLGLDHHLAKKRPQRVATSSSLRLPGATICLAGQEGLEPPTPGFGDRCSTS